MVLQSENQSRCVAFVFPMASGHINPALPVSRDLIQKGHKVHFLCREQMREAIEDTGATFHNEIELLPEMYTGRQVSMVGALDDIKKELGLQDSGLMSGFMLLREVMLELQLPGVLRWLCAVRAEAVVYCPLINYEAAYAAKILGIPSVGLLTTAGPGSCTKFLQEVLNREGKSIKGLKEEVQEFEPKAAASQRLKESYGLELSPTKSLDILGFMEPMGLDHCTLVTTSQELQDPMTPELQEAYEAAGANFQFVGPLLDQQGARRAAGHKYEHEKVEAALLTQDTKKPLELLEAAKAAGRKVVFVSMGTVITGDSPDFGWHCKVMGPSGKRTGLTGGQLCQAAFGGAFDAFGAPPEDLAAPLLLVSLGPQEVALEGLQPPGNAFCLPVLPQVDLLKAGVDLFLTHGGQNSFMESLSTGVPVVVCPGFGDQPVNAQKAVEMGVGLKVDRPFPEDGDEETAAAAYREEVKAALLRVMSEPAFRAAAEQCAKGLRTAGGVSGAAEKVLEAARRGAASSGQGEIWDRYSKVAAGAESVEDPCSPRAAVMAGA